MQRNQPEGLVDGTLKITENGNDLAWGGVALSGWDALFDNLKVAYDTDNDDIIDDPGDDIVISEDFASTSLSLTYDDAGNLTQDMDYAFVYDGWNNLVKVKAQNDADVTVGVYAFYADNRRASKTVTHRGLLDGTTYFFYDGLREIEERDGSENVTQQYVWGQEYIDQLLMIRGRNGTWFAHQDANWNVIALTTPNGDVAEEVQYQPYGLPQVKRHIAFGDSDADGDVDSTDNTAHTAALTTYNRLFDADLDGDVSSTSGDADKTAWDASYNEPAANVTMVVPNRGFSPSGNPFLFTGRRLDAETGLYFYRFRTYHPTLKVFLQRDPLGYVDGASLYGYVVECPVGMVDPLGELTCAQIKQTIQNLVKSIKRRTDDLKNDPLGLPGTDPNDHLKPSLSRRGHQYLINLEKAILAVYRVLDAVYCPPSNPQGTWGPGMNIKRLPLPKPRQKPFPIKKTTPSFPYMPVIAIPLPAPALPVAGGRAPIPEGRPIGGRIPWIPEGIPALGNLCILLGGCLTPQQEHELLHMNCPPDCQECRPWTNGTPGTDDWPPPIGPS